MMRGKPWPWAKFTVLASGALTGLALSTAVLAANDLLPTGMKITLTAAPGSVFQTLSWPNPDSTKPGIEADHAVDIALSPDGKTLVVVTSVSKTGYYTKG